MKYTYFFIFSLLTFFACQNDFVPERVTFKSTPLDSVYQDLRPAIQEFSIDNNQPNKIKADKGTEIFVPENSFVDASGNPINGKVEVEIIEAFSLEDFITAGLVTQSNGQLLISNGMINIDASADGETVELQEGKELTVSMPTMESSMEGFQMFTGNGQNWVVDSSMMMVDDYLIPIPLDLLYPQTNYFYYWFIGTNSIFEKSNEDKLKMISLKTQDFENTILATKAFKNRLVFLYYLTQNISILDSRKYFLGNRKISDRKCNPSIWYIYSENLDKPIEELDRLAKQKYIQYFVENEEALIQLSKEFKKQGALVDNPYPWIYSRKYWNEEDFSKEKFLSILEDFSFNEKGKVKTINDYGVDLNSKDAFSQLNNKGLSSSEIDEILTYNFKRNVVLDKLRSEKKALEAHATISKFYQTTFSSKKLGWINCDRFYDSPDAKEAKILASNSSKTDLNYIDFSLIFPRLNARLSASKNEDGKYAFTSSGRYSKLPIGEKAIVTGISLQNDSIFFAAQEIVIEENMDLKLDLKLTTKEELRDSISALF